MQYPTTHEFGRGRAIAAVAIITACDGPPSSEPPATSTRTVAGSAFGPAVTRPPAPDVEASVSGQSIVDVWPERLGEHDADLAVVPAGAFYDADPVRVLPTFQVLLAVRDGRTLQVDGDMWFGDFAFAVDWITTDLAAIADGDPQSRIGAPEDALDRWQEFLDRLPAITEASR